jgi:hypothetical protein
MWPVSSRFIDTLSRSHERRAYVEILHDGVVTATLNSTLLPDPVTGALVQSIGGSIQVDRTAVRRSGTVNFLDISANADANDVLDLFPTLVTEIRPWVGLHYWDAPAVDPPGVTSWEYVPLGTLVVSGVDTSNYPQVTVQGYDRMWLVGPFANALSIPSGTVIADAMNLILGQQIPTARLDTSGIIATEHTTSALLYAEQDDAVQKLADMAATTGQVLYVDQMGVFTTDTEPSTDDEPVMTYASGYGGSAMMRPKQVIDASQAYNAVVFTGEGAATVPVRGYAQDDNPNSSTYVGKVGRRPYFASSPLITTQHQAVLAAKTRLLNILGIPDTISVPVPPNPALESGDVIMATDTSQGIDFPVIIDAFPAALRASDGEQVLTCRPRVIR